MFDLNRVHKWLVGTSDPKFVHLSMILLSRQCYQFIIIDLPGFSGNVAKSLDMNTYELIIVGGGGAGTWKES